MDLIQNNKPVLFQIRLANILNNIYLVDDIIPLFNKLTVNDGNKFKIDNLEVEKGTFDSLFNFYQTMKCRPKKEIRVRFITYNARLE